MIVTEEEAKTIRCQESFGPHYVTADGGQSHMPVMHAVSIHQGAYGAVLNGPALPTVAAPAFCIGSKCMAWRWHMLEGDAWTVSAPHGYCGKAGKP